MESLRIRRQNDAVLSIFRKTEVKKRATFSKRTVTLLTMGSVSLASVVSADEPPLKWNAVRSELSSTTLGGYVDTAATWRPGTDQYPGVAANIPAYSFSKNDGFNLNAIDIFLDHPQGEGPWATGYRVELMAGPDSAGLGGFGGAGTVNVRNASVSLRTPVGNGIDWKIGVWDSIIGYESTSGPLDPNYTRSYGYTLLPRTYTGVMAVYQANELLSFRAGVAEGLSGAVPKAPAGVGSIESQKAYMAEVRVTAPDSAGFLTGATLNFGVIDAAGTRGGTVSAPFPAGSGYTVFHIDTTVPTTLKALRLGATFDYDDIHNGGPGNPGNDSVWAVGVYDNYQATGKLSFNLRAEYLSNENGLATLDAASFPTIPVNPDFAAAEEVTVTVEYNLWANVISRLEFRWDHVEHGSSFGYNQGDVAITNLYGVNRSSDFLLALNLIYLF